MQHYSQDDPYEREPLDSYYPQETPSRRRPVPPQNDYSHPGSPFRDSPGRSYREPQPQPSRSQPGYEPYSHQTTQSAYTNYGDNGPAPPPPRHGGNYSRAGPRRGDETYGRPLPSSTITPGADNFSESASGGMAGIAYSVAERNARESGVEAMRTTDRLPPPPSRTQYPNTPPQGYPGYHGGYSQDPNGYYTPNDPFDRESASSLGIGPAPAASRSPSRSRENFGHPYADPALGAVDPTAIEDDGDDGLYYHRPGASQRNSMLSSSNSDHRGARQGLGAAAAVGGATAAGGVLTKRSPAGFDTESIEKSSWGNKKKNKKWKWVIIIVVFLVVAGAIVGGVVGGLVAGGKNGGKSGHAGQSADDDEAENGDLDINSSEIKKLLNNPDLHKVFPGMDYTPFNTQYPDCVGYPPSQNNVTRDVAVLSQLTNKIRLYGTDCNQTQMLIHAVRQLKMEDDIKIWMGVWQDGNTTTNDRQLDQMWDIIDEYGQDPFEGIIVANEILFREQMTESSLASLMSSVRKKLRSKGVDLPVATSDLGDDWTSDLAQDSDYIMANIHPFFAGTPAEKAAQWTLNFWKNKDGPFWKSDKSKNIISETGWPSEGGTDCGGAPSCTNGAVASIDGMNRFMEDWVCQALEKETQYFWFEAFDEPWKVQFNEKGKNWEDKWGLMDVNRKLKDGVKIPDCGGKTV